MLDKLTNINLPELKDLLEIKERSAYPTSQFPIALNKLKCHHSIKEKCVLLASDCRTLLSNLPDSSISCVITSPPYGNLKDYGSINQIGFGQDWESEYLSDLEKIFAQLYRVAKSGASMWIVLDMIKSDGEMIPLPWEVITRARQIGWTFQDLVIWDKGKSLPWSSRGKFRGVCEYILLLGKGKLSQFNLDAVRDSENLSPYWVKYPERYHPDGKAPSDLWHFPIPQQGKWSKKQSRHFCPFPLGLVARMITISTSPGDIVLDPFAGTGSVIAVASYLDRFGVGIEINPTFVNDFDKSGFESIIEKSKIELPNKNSTNNSLREIIINLRMLKYAKTLFNDLLRADQLGVEAHDFVGAFFIKNALQTQSSENDDLDPSNLGQIDLQILLREGSNNIAVNDAVSQRIKTAPLSTFGIRASVETVPYELWSEDKFVFSASSYPWYIYRNGRFNSYDVEIDNSELRNTIVQEINNKRKGIPSIISSVKLSLESSHK